MALTEADIQPQLSRRRPGQSHLSTPRDEKDAVKILSGTEKGYTLGTPIALLVPNEDQRPKDYQEMDDVPRPSHADYTYQLKYGVRSSSGGGRSSARETIGRVAAGAIAEKWLKERYGVEIVAWVSAVGDKVASTAFENRRDLSRDIIDASLVRCPDAEAESAMIQEIEACKAGKDSVGGVVTCVCRNVPAGLGEPCFDKLEAMLAHAMLSIPATKGFEIGSGFAGAKMRGSAHNDMFVAVKPDEERKVSPASPVRKIRTATNNSGGIQGGISNGEDIVIRVAFKPPATIGQEQHTCSFEGNDGVLAAKGRHDPCVVPRAVPIVEAMAALVIADAALIQESRQASSSLYDIMGKVSAPKQ
eukprot:TRINITY_DN6010_c0_g1_i1.p1 TRINITY_DN6010_c0_g1~~TRINITY_DN6010_c0_g1_i1.p1  ORF type:complete len:411 (-),score=104.53 TRINITY_DN6010_c0_g1_i1:32-1111(-)